MKKVTIELTVDEEMDVTEAVEKLCIQTDSTYLIVGAVDDDRDDAVKMDFQKFVDETWALSQQSVRALTALGIPTRSELLNRWRRLSQADVSDILDESLTTRMNQLTDLDSLVDEVLSHATDVSCEADRLRDAVNDLNKALQPEYARKRG